MPAVSGSPTQNASSVANLLELAGIPDDAFKAGDLAYVDGIGSYRLVRTTPAPSGSIPAYSGNGYWEPLSAAPSGPAGGDLDLFYPDPRVVGIEGIPIEAPPPANGDALIYNAAPFPPGSPPVWEHAPIVFGGGPPTGPAGGSLAGVYPNPTLSLVGTAGTYGSASVVPVLTTTLEGRVSNVVNTPILIAETQVSGLVADLFAKADKATNILAGAGLAGGGNLSSDRTISMPNVGTPGTYGNATTIPVITTDAQGRVSNVTTATIGPYLSSIPVYGSFSSTAIQPINIAPNGPTTVTFDTVDDANGIQLVGALPSTQIQVTQDGIYEFNVSPELNVPTGNSDITFWPAVDGTPVPNSSSTIQVGNNNRFSLPFVAYILRLNAGQHVEFLFWGTSGTPQLFANAAPAAPGSPATPSIIVIAKRLGDIPPP